MDMEVLDSIVSFINTNFIDGDNKRHVKNLFIFIRYLSNIDYQDFDYDCFKYILDNSTKINFLMDFILKSKDRSFYIQNQFIYSLLSTYIFENKLDIDLDVKEEKEEKEKIDYDFLEDPIDPKTNSLDSEKLFKRELAGAVPYTELEEIEIFTKYKKATGYKKEQIRNEIIYHNLRYVYNLAAKKSFGRNISINDLIQEGSLGLMKAIDKFDLNKGYKFSTYSRWWIKQAMNTAIAGHYRNVTAYANEQISKIYRVIREYEMTYGEKPDEYYISEKTGINLRRVQELLTITDIVSLNEKVNNDEIDSYELQDLLIAEEEDNGIFDSYAARIDFRNAVLTSPYLDDRQKRVIDLRFGLNKGRMETLEDVGKRIGVTRERVRQIEAKSIRNLRKDQKIRTYNPDGEKDYDDIYKKYSHFL